MWSVDLRRVFVFGWGHAGWVAPRAEPSFGLVMKMAVVPGWLTNARCVGFGR
jgi:hypothetical protein